ncbi:hypothetical protein PIB30_050552 [Stylosanthes scabra]|uniref:Putative plant transposon protein domain-containing protein n=1 Tax=Stylosanthes scabra TaxID=79078 RepID=A0ABU6ZGF2_9FABA|nr:hypothetical protein [Stylosanthes scabra]
MYEPSIPINLSWVWEFYANKTKKDQREIFLRGRKITCSVSTIEKTLGIPKFKGKCRYSKTSEAYNNKTLNMDEVLQVIGKEGATWHETTLSMEIVLLIYALMRDMPVCLVSVMRYAMNANPTKTKTHLLIFPMFITKWARDNNVPRFPGDVIVNISKSQQFFPYGKWREDDEEVTPPVPSPAGPVDVPAPSAPSSPEPSRKELMRALLAH